jgi:RNA polymerase sigma-70 factor (ECF subfamily)
VSRSSHPQRDEAFTAFVAARSRSLLRTAYLLTGDHGLAEDLLQTALTKTYLAWGRIRDPEAVEAYVRQTMITTLTSWWRRRWRGETPTETLPEPTSDATVDVTEASDERASVFPHLRALPVRQRAVVVLRYYEDMPESEIAQVLGCSPGTVKSQAHRALATLRERMGDEAGRELASGGMS